MVNSAISFGDFASKIDFLVSLQYSLNSASTAYRSDCRCLLFTSGCLNTVLATVCHFFLKMFRIRDFDSSEKLLCCVDLGLTLTPLSVSRAAQRVCLYLNQTMSDLELRVPWQHPGCAEKSWG